MSSKKDDLIEVNLFFYKISGFWTSVATGNKSEKKFSYYLYHLSIACCLYFVFTSILIYDGLVHTCDIVTLINKIAILVTSIEAAFKTIYMYKKRKHVQCLYKIFRKDFLSCKHFYEDSSNYILKKAAKSINLWGSLIIIIIMSTGFMWSFYPLVSIMFNDISNLKIYPTWYPINVSLPVYRELCYIFEATITLHNGLFLSTSNGYILVVTFALEAQFKILQKSLEKIDKNVKKKILGNVLPSKDNSYVNTSELSLTSESQLERNSLNDLLFTCITDHQKILQVIKEIENIYSPLNLCQMIISLVTISVLAVLLTVQVSSSNDSASVTHLTRFKMLLYISCGIAELFLVCWCGHTISDQAGSLCESFYATEWPGAYTSFKKNIYTAMMRCRKPVHFTAGKFYAVNLFTFTSIMKASYSYFSVLYGFISSAHQKL